MAPAKPRLFIFVFFLVFGAVLVWTNVEKLFESSPGVRPVRVVGLVVAGAMCGAGLSGFVTFVNRRAATDKAESAN